MAGSVFQVGEQRIRPGVYIRVTDVGEPPEAIVPQGTVAALFRASWGPLGKDGDKENVVTLGNAEAISAVFGKDGEDYTLGVPAEAFRGGCRKVLGFRLGAGGDKATLKLKDTTQDSAKDVVQLDALYVGERGNEFSVTVRDSLADENKREMLLYEGVTLRQTIEFAKGAGGDGEPKALVDAIAASNSPWVAAKVLNDGGNKVLAAVVATSAKLAGGSDPIVTGEDFSNGLLAIEALDWNVLCVDTDDAITHAVVQTYVDRVRNEGKRVIGVVGEPTSITMATRFAHARAFNDPAIAYVANGFEGADGITREGYLAAARVAGMIAGSQTTDSLTHAVARGATEVVGALTNAEVEEALLSGALVFTMSAQKQVQIEQGINTFVTVTADYDAGWKKIRRVGPGIT